MTPDANLSTAQPGSPAVPAYDSLSGGALFGFNNQYRLANQKDSIRAHIHVLARRRFDMLHAMERGKCGAIFSAF